MFLCPVVPKIEPFFEHHLLDSGSCPCRELQTGTARLCPPSGTGAVIRERRPADDPVDMARNQRQRVE